MMREFNFTTTPIVNIVNDIIIDSLVKNASDIHNRISQQLGSFNHSKV